MKKKLFLAGAALIIVVLTVLFVLTSSIEPEAPLPNPNGYDDFVKAAAMVSANTSDWPALSAEPLRQMVVTNHPALELVRAGLLKECSVVPYEMHDLTNSHLSDLGGMKSVAHAFCAAGRLALIHGRTNEAAYFALECIQFGQESARGGVVIDGLVGIAIQAIGRARLEEALPGMDADAARKIVAVLDDIANERESAEDIFKREAQWARRGRFGKVGVFTQLLAPFQSRKMRESAQAKFVKLVNDLQRTKLRAAAHAYELDHGEPPAGVHELVPQYLKSLPLDPESGKELPLN
jgi:hypothetical protein